MKKIMLFVPSMRSGGAERVMVNLFKNIDKSRFEAKLVIVNKEGKMVNLVEGLDGVVDLGIRRVRFSSRKIIETINDYNPDIVFSTLSHLNILILSVRKFLKGKPYIVVREANTPSEYIEQFGVLKRVLSKLLIRYYYNRADLIVAQCNDMKFDISEYIGVPNSKIVSIYNPIDYDGIINKMIEHNPYNGDSINIVAVGRLEYAKGFDILIKSFKIVKDREEKVKLHILGEGFLKNELMDLVEELNLVGSVFFHGFVSNPYPFYHYSNCFVLSSRWEGFPNVMLEALACRAKVVSTDCKSGPLEILEDGKHGIVVEVEDIKGLANGILNALECKNKSSLTGEEYNVCKIVQKYEEAFQDLMMKENFR